jgi:TonB family protein
MKLTLFHCVFLLIYCSNVLAQQQSVTYYKKPGIHVSNPDSADFMRVVSKPDSGEVLFNVAEFYMNKSPKMVGKSTVSNATILQGQYMTFYPSGKKRETANYNTGRKDGDNYIFYPNGQLYVHKKYLSSPTNVAEQFLILTCRDSTGNELVKNGDGTYVGYDEDCKIILESGLVKQGQKEGLWKGNNGSKSLNLSLEEDYNNNKLISGKAVDTAGNVYTYNEREVQPLYPGGLQGLANFLARQMKYPSNARKKNIQGKVFVTFVITKDGSPTDFEVARSPDDELSAEAIRVLKKMPNWTPGLQYGRPVKVSYTMPIAFSLN